MTKKARGHPCYQTDLPLQYPYLGQENQGHQKQLWALELGCGYVKVQQIQHSNHR